MILTGGFNVPGPRRPLTTRFWHKVQRTGGCWNWVGATSQGWGIINVEGRNERAHRVSWRFANGYLPRHVHVRQVCGNKVCVRPDHLVLVAEVVLRNPTGGKRIPRRR